MSKTITITSAVVNEFIFRPNENIALAVNYKLLDNTGAVVAVKSLTFPESDLPTPAITALSTIASRLLTYIQNKEGL